MPFKLKAQTTGGQKRDAKTSLDTAASLSKRAAVPNANALVMMESAPKVARPQRLPQVASLNIVIYKVTDRAADVWPQYQEDPTMKLWQVQLDHAARPSFLFQHRDAFEEFLRQAHAKDTSVPETLRGLEEEGGIRLVIADRADPDGVQMRVRTHAVPL